MISTQTSIKIIKVNATVDLPHRTVIQLFEGTPENKQAIENIAEVFGYIHTQWENLPYGGEQYWIYTAESNAFNYIAGTLKLYCTSQEIKFSKMR